MTGAHESRMSLQEEAEEEEDLNPPTQSPPSVWTGQEMYTTSPVSSPVVPGWVGGNPYFEEAMSEPTENSFTALNPWFVEQTQDFKPSNQSQIRLWAAAMDHIGPPSNVEAWKAWVCWCIDQAQARGIKDPVSILMLRLRETSPKDAPEVKAKIDVHRQGMTRPSDVDAYKAAMQSARKVSSPSQPSSEAIMRLKPTHGYYGAYKLVEAAWELQGRPAIRDFDFTPLEASL